jgi:hypothetical protein
MDNIYFPFSQGFVLVGGILFLAFAIKTYLYPIDHARLFPDCGVVLSLQDSLRPRIQLVAIPVLVLHLLLLLIRRCSFKHNPVRACSSGNVLLALLKTLVSLYVVCGAMLMMAGASFLLQDTDSVLRVWILLCVLVDLVVALVLVKYSYRRSIS